MMWLAFCAASLFIVGTYAENTLQVETTSGTVHGAVVDLPSGSKSERFLGISYAKAPVGELRFAPPQAFHQDGVIEATSYGHSCPQLTTGFEEDIPFIRGPEGETEDCLNLNVWTPHPRPENAAVLVFIHGGVAISTGSAAEAHYEGSELAHDEGVIVVSINYRLAELGFLFMDLPDAPGNLGLMDQTLALHWVKDNIAHFGGDPHKVTVFGDTSGSLGVGIHMVIPSGENLFQRAVLLDEFPVLSKYSAVSKEEALAIAKNFSEAAGCTNDDRHATLTCLREKSLQDLITATINGVLLHGHYFLPVIDGEYLPDHPKILLKSGKTHNDIDVLIGTTYHAGFLANRYVIHQKPTEDHVVTKENMQTLISAFFKDANEYLKSIITFHYTDWKHPESPISLRHEAIDFSSDFSVLCPAKEFADELVKSGHDVYRFHVSFHKSSSKYPKWTGLLEDEQFDIIFGHASASKGYSESEVALSHSFMKHLANFMKTGNPNEGGHHEWPRYNLRDRSYLKVEPGHEIGGVIQTNLHTQECSFFLYGYKYAKQASKIMEANHCH